MNQSETSKLTPLDMLVWLTLAVTSSLLFTFYILSLLCKISYQNTLNFNLLFHTHDCRMTSSRAISLILLTDVLYLFRTTQDFAGHVSDKHPKSHRPPELEVSGGPAHCQGHERLPKTQVWQCVMTRVFFIYIHPPPPEPGRRRTSFSPFIRLCKHCATFRCLKPGGGGGPGFCTTSRGHFVTSVKHAVGWWRRSIFLSRACFQPRYQRYAFGWTGTGGSVSSRAFFQSWWMVDEVVQS